MTSEEHFHQNGPWIDSSKGFRVRALGPAGMEYVRGSLRLELDAEGLATRGFVIYPVAIPAVEREQVVDDVTRAWTWAGFDVESIESR